MSNGLKGPVSDRAGLSHLLIYQSVIDDAVHFQDSISVTVAVKSSVPLDKRIDTGGLRHRQMRKETKTYCSSGCRCGIGRRPGRPVNVHKNCQGGTLLILAVLDPRHTMNGEPMKRSLVLGSEWADVPVY